jgi:serine/threonine-protein kinase
VSDVATRLNTALVDRYRVERELGAGGMATVWLAHDLKHEREVAIKVLHPDLGAALGSERFLAEIKTTARLQHPHILPLLDSGEADGLLYYVMPFVRGETLRTRLTRESQLPVADALRLAREVADALTEAHALGIVHRDIKPENILLQGPPGNQHALVADFGIALAVQQAGGARMTQTGLSLGTPQYMAPEQAMGDRAVDHRADQYALAAVTYEMLTSEPPHSGNNPQAIVAKLLTEAVRPVSVLRPAVPAHVDAAVQVALQKLPADRFPSVAEFSSALQGASAHPLVTGLTAAKGASAPTPARSRARTWLAAAVVVTVCVGVGWIAARVSRAGGGGRAASDADPSAARVITLRPEPGLAGIALSPDGTQYTARVRDSAGNVLKLFSLTGAAPRVLYRGTTGVTQFSPSGRLLASWEISAQALLLADLATGNVRTLATGVSVRSLAWVGDSAVLMLPNTTGQLHRYSVTGAAPMRLGEIVRNGVELRQIAAADNGQLLATVRIADRAMLATIDANGELLDTIAALPNGGRFQVAADIALVLAQGRVWGIPLDRTRRRATGPVAEVLGLQGSSEASGFSAASSGDVLVLRTETAGERDLMLVDRTGRAVPAIKTEGAYRQPRFAPSGRSLSTLFAGYTTTSGQARVIDATRGTIEPVLQDSVVFATQWMPDGGRLLLVLIAANRAGGRVVSAAADGSGAVQELLRRPNFIFEIERTPDGRALVWREDAPVTGRDIRMTSLDRPNESVPLRATNADERGIALSRDGQWLAYTSNEGGRDEIYVTRLVANGPRWAVTQGGGGEPRWGAGGELLYRKSDTVFTVSVRGRDVPEISAPQRVLVYPSISAPFEALWDVAPDGKRFAMVVQRGEEKRELVLLMNWQGKWRAEQGKP